MKMLKHVVWILTFLLALELVLELRAHRRGFSTIAFGPVDMVTEEQAAGSEFAARYGPAADFPFRSERIPLQSRSGSTRVWVASASHGEDIYTEVNSIFPVLLGDRLKHLGMEVLNASSAGHTIHGNIEMLLSEGPRWKPDIVLLYQLPLDVTRLAARFSTQDQDADVLSDANQGSDGVGDRSILDSVRKFYESTTLYALAKQHIGGRLTGQCILAGDLPYEAEVEFRRLLELFVETCMRLGATPVLCTFAASHDRSNIDEMPGELKAGVYRYNPHLSLGGWAKLIKRYNHVIMQVASENGVACIDIEKELGGQSKYFRDFVHFNVDGHRVMAELLASGLRESFVQNKSAAAVQDGDHSHGVRR